MYKGYLYINDDLFLKFWELQNLNLSFPWLNPYSPIKKKWYHYSECIPIYNIINKKTDWKNNIVSFNGFFEIVAGMSDFFIYLIIMLRKYVIFLMKCLNLKYS